MSQLLAGLVIRFGRDCRVYSVTFDENGDWTITVMSTDNGEIIGRFTNAHVATHMEE
jgi:hypothetical protein